MASQVVNEDNCTGGGCFIFDNDLNTILVYSKKKDSTSVPKGRREKKESVNGKKKEMESFEECVYREVEEETGIKKDNIKTIPDVLLTEPIGKSILVGYRVGVVIKRPDEFTFDKNELATVGWYNYQEVCKVLGGNRLALYKDALAKAKQFLASQAS
jgi:8-oxo-dGTP pyrophosphatase MutT (NUDIX family)